MEAHQNHQNQHQHQHQHQHQPGEEPEEDSEMASSPLPSSFNPKLEKESSPLRSPDLLPSSFNPKPFDRKPFDPKPFVEPKPFSPSPPTEKPQSTAMISMDRRTYAFSPLRSPSLEKKSIQTVQTIQPPESVPVNSPVIVVNRSIREELSAMAKMDRREDGFSGGGVVNNVEDGGGGGGDRRPRAVSSILWRMRKEAMMRRAALGFRVCSVVFCLISFSVMAADKTQGWAGDSFDRYKEYRYCLSVAVIGFVYAGFQAYDLAYNFISGKHVIRHHWRYTFDFSMDQILTYLLISASSAAASRVDDWQTNWGKDEFTEMASASIGMSFLAFVSFAFSSLISGYNLCTHNNT